MLSEKCLPEAMQPPRQQILGAEIRILKALRISPLPPSYFKDVFGLEPRTVKSMLDRLERSDHIAKPKRKSDPREITQKGKEYVLNFYQGMVDIQKL